MKYTPGYRHFKRTVKTTDSNHNMFVYPNLLGRDFAPGTLNRAWVSDITYVVTSVSNFTGDGFYLNWRNQDECLSLRRLVRSDSAPATLFSYHSWNAKPETLTLTLSSHDFEYYGKVLEVLPHNGKF